jgi:hypothetical protein
MRGLRIERSDLNSKRQRRDLVMLIVLAIVAIGAALYFVPRPSLFTQSRPINVEHDWILRIGKFNFGLLSDRDYTYIAYGPGYAGLPIPLPAFMVCTFVLTCSALIWAVSYHRRNESAA